mgnify:CR=1 FL=1
MTERIFPLFLLTIFGWPFPNLAAEDKLAAEGEIVNKPEKTKEAPDSYSNGVIIQFHGVILPQLEWATNRKLDTAVEMGADLIILEIDSPGGALESTLNLATRLRDMRGTRTVAYIPDEALSGAAIVALACDDIVMGPLARLGDAGPVFQGEDALFRHAPEKIRSDLVRRVRDIATAKNRPPALAEAMVDFNLEVFRVDHKDTDETTYMSQQEIDSSDNPADWKKGPLVLESQKDSFLEVNGKRAVALQLAHAAVNNLDELNQRYPATRPSVVLVRNGADQAADILNLPFITGLILVVGLIALWFELSAPGVGIGGLVSGLCVTLFFWSRFLGGTAGWLEVILVVAGVAFLAVEVFVIPGFGIAGISGLLLLVSGTVMASQTQFIPQSERDMSDLGVSVMVLLASGGVAVIAAAALSRHFGSVPILNRLVLRAPSRDPDQAQEGDKGKPLVPVAAGHTVGVGDWGVAESPLRPAGKAVFGEEYVDVVTDGSFVSAGQQVRVIKISGNHIVVREIDE